MNNLKNYSLEMLDSLKLGSDSSIYKTQKGSTQKYSMKTEDFINDEFIKPIFENGEIADSVFIVRAGSQQKYDWIIAKRDLAYFLNEEDWRKFTEKIYEKDVKLNGIINEVYTSLNKSTKDKILRIEIKKSEAGVYTCNDTMPDNIDPVLYFLFDTNENILYKSLSTNMFNYWNESNKGKFNKKINSDKEHIEKLRKQKIKYWKGFPIHSTPRMTYRIEKKFAHLPEEHRIENHIEIVDIINKLIESKFDETYLKIINIHMYLNKKSWKKDKDEITILKIIKKCSAGKYKAVVYSWIDDSPLKPIKICFASNEINEIKLNWNSFKKLQGKTENSDLGKIKEINLFKKLVDEDNLENMIIALDKKCNLKYFEK